MFSLVLKHSAQLSVLAAHGVIKVCEYSLAILCFCFVLLYKTFIAFFSTNTLDLEFCCSSLFTRVLIFNLKMMHLKSSLLKIHSFVADVVEQHCVSELFQSQFFIFDVKRESLTKRMTTRVLSI